MKKKNLLTLVTIAGATVVVGAIPAVISYKSKKRTDDYDLSRDDFYNEDQWEEPDRSNAYDFDDIENPDEVPENVTVFEKRMEPTEENIKKTKAELKRLKRYRKAQLKGEKLARKAARKTVKDTVKAINKENKLAEKRRKKQ